MMQEEWRPVTGFEGLYEVSDKGRLRSLDHVSMTANRWGPNKRRFPGRVLTLSIASTGYQQATLCDGEGGRCQKLLHWLVAEAFHGPRPHGKDVLHGDGNKLNCTKGNLRYGYPKENSEDAIEHGHQVRGERQGSSRFTEAQIREIHALRGKMFQRDIAIKFGTSRQYIVAIHNGRSWGHVK